MITGNEPANSFGFTTADGSSHVCEYGLTIRQHFAAMAMIGLVSQQAPVDRVINEATQHLTKQLAEASVILSDALIEALNKNQAT